MEVVSASSPAFANAAGTLITMNVVFKENNGVSVPFTAVESGDQDYTHELFEKAKNGDFGSVQAYSPPVVAAFSGPFGSAIARVTCFDVVPLRTTILNAQALGETSVTLTVNGAQVVGTLAEAQALLRGALALV